MRIDIRDEGVDDNDSYVEIRFSETDYIHFEKDSALIVITDMASGENEIDIYKRDIPNLIKALQKAQEIQEQ